MKRIAMVAALLALSAGTARAQQGTLLYWWTQAGAQGEWQLRTVYDGGTSCPAPASTRALPSDSFPVLVCQQVLGTQPVQLRGMPRPVAAPPAEVGRVVVIGDTGCQPTKQDGCSDPVAWPFAAVAARAAQAGGDLTVHVGDYIYREAAWSCAGLQPCGDNWKTWVADWFAPVGELLPARPWVFARGNHEDCTRGGHGWFLFFDPRDVPAGGCAGTTEPYAVRIPGVGTLLIMDTACAPSYSTGCWPIGSGSSATNDSTKAIPAYAAQFGQLAGLVPAGEPAWLVTHVPIFARDGAYADSLGAYILQSALRRLPYGGELPPAVTLSLMGHIHTWEALDFASPRAPVLVLGDGGTAESAALPTPTIGAPFAGVALEAYRRNTSYGFTTLQSNGPGWSVTLTPASGPPAPPCTLSGSQLSC